MRRLRLFLDSRIIRVRSFHSLTTISKTAINHHSNIHTSDHMSDTLQTAEAGEKGPSKSALKKAKKLADSQAMKAAKKIAGPASTPAQAGAGPSARKAAKAEKVVEEVIVQDVPLGQKKGLTASFTRLKFLTDLTMKLDMSLPMANSYHPLAVEAGWQAWLSLIHI